MAGCFCKDNKKCILWCEEWMWNDEEMPYGWIVAGGSNYKQWSRGMMSSWWWWWWPLYSLASKNDSIILCFLKGVLIKLPDTQASHTFWIEWDNQIRNQFKKNSFLNGNDITNPDPKRWITHWSFIQQLNAMESFDFPDRIKVKHKTVKTCYLSGFK